MEKKKSRGDLMRRQAIRSFENLVALANDQERWQDARRMVWRDKGEPAVELSTLNECFRHALHGGMRAGTLAFAIRSGFNLFLFLYRVIRAPRRIKILLLRRAVLGQDSFRFGAMLGTFVFLYKFFLNALPILLPTSQSLNEFNLDKWRESKHTEVIDEEEDGFEAEGTGADTDVDVDADAESDVPLLPITNKRSRKRQSATISPLSSDTMLEMNLPAKRRLSTQAQAHIEWIHKRTKRWHAVAAGCIASLSLLFEKRGRRVVIAQQLFVRGLQGSYNEFSAKHDIKIPFGPVIVFSLACGQILYAYLLRPDTLSPGYNAWIQRASQTHEETIKINRNLVREGYFELEDMERIMNHKTTHPTMRQRLAAELGHARYGNFGPLYASCAVVHPKETSCALHSIKLFFEVFGWSIPFYGALHFIPPLLFKRKLFLQHPQDMLQRAFRGTIRSSSFLGTFVLIYFAYFCSKHRLHAHLKSHQLLLNGSLTIPLPLIEFLRSKPSFFLGGMLCGLALLVEAKHRRPDFAMYVLPKALESAWRMARGKGMVKGPKFGGEVLLCMMGMGMVMNAYQHHPEHLSSLVRRILYQFIGPN